MDRFSEFSRLESSLQFKQKTPSWFLSPLNSIWTEHPTTFVGSSPGERNRVCVEALLVVWSDFSESRESLTHVCVFVEKLLGNFDRDRFCFGFQGTT